MSGWFIFQLQTLVPILSRLSALTARQHLQHHHLQQTKYDGMGSFLCSLLHHALALLLCSLLCRQLEECETHLSQLQIYPWSLQGWSLGSRSPPVSLSETFVLQFAANSKNLNKSSVENS